MTDPISKMFAEVQTDQPKVDPKDERAAFLTANRIILQSVEDGFGDGTVFIASIQGLTRFATDDTQDGAIRKLLKAHRLNQPTFLAVD